MTISDLSPDALSRLEAKLLADVEVVRRMRVLMQEHLGVPGAMGWRAAGGTVAAGAAVPAGPVVVKAVRKSLDEVGLEYLGELPAEGFLVDDLRKKLTKAGCTPDDSSLKTFLLRLIRQGRVHVLKAKRGRGGSTYGHNFSCPAPEESSSISPENEPPASVSEPPQADQGGPVIV